MSRRNPDALLADIVFTGPHAGERPREKDIRFFAEAPNPRYDPEDYVIRGEKRWWEKPTYAVGSISISRDPDGTFAVSTVGVSPEYQRKGIAKRLYDMAWEYARAHGGRLRSGWVQSPRAAAYWEGMVEAGKAEPYTDETTQFNVTKKGWQRTRNPRPTTTAERTDPDLWEAVKREVTSGSKGGKPGQWSARKAQLAVALYQQRGGGYYGPKDPRNSLAKWTREKWRTKSGRPSLETGERYLPSRAIAALTDAEYAATTRAKRAGMRKGQQFVPQPEDVALKVRAYRKNRR